MLLLSLENRKTWVKVRAGMPVSLVAGAGLKPAPTRSTGCKPLAITRTERFETVPYGPYRLPNLNPVPHPVSCYLIHVEKKVKKKITARYHLTYTWTFSSRSRAFRRKTLAKASSPVGWVTLVALFLPAKASIPPVSEGIPARVFRCFRVGARLLSPSRGLLV